jgi:hypothetical protein
VNLRGLQGTGAIFMAPTYIFIAWLLGITSIHYIWPIAFCIIVLLGRYV